MLVIAMRDSRCCVVSECDNSQCPKEVKYSVDNVLDEGGPGDHVGSNNDIPSF